MSEVVLVSKLIEEFRSDLKKGRYPTDQNLSMQAISKRYGVSRPLVRVAFKTMEGEGLLERRGEYYYVFQLSINRLWQNYQLSRLISKVAPQRFIALNPTATSLSIFDRSGDLVSRTEQFFMIIAGLAGQHDFAMVMARNNALLHKMRLAKEKLIGERIQELEELVDRLSVLDLTTYERLIDAYHDLRLSKLADLVYIAQQAVNFGP